MILEISPLTLLCAVHTSCEHTGQAEKNSEKGI